MPSHFERVDLNHPASSNPSDNLPLTQPACQVRDLPTNEPIQVPVTQPLMQLLPQPQNPFPLVSKPPTQTQQGMLQPVQGQATQYQISTQHLPSVQTNQQYHTYQPPAPMMCNYPPAYQQPIPQVGQPHPSVEPLPPYNYMVSNEVPFERAWKPGRSFHYVAYNSFDGNSR